MVNHFSTNARAQFQHPYQFARAPPFGNPVPQYRPPSLMTHGPPRVPNFQQMNMNPLYHQQSLMVELFTANRNSLLTSMNNYENNILNF